MVLLAVALLAGAASFAATQHWAFAHGAPGHRRQSAPLTPKPVSAASLERLRAAASEQQVAARAPFVSGTHLLLSAAPRLERAGLRPIAAPAAILVDASTGAVLWARERVPVWKLMYGLLLFSGNDDALELAIATTGSRGAFLRLMNEKAVELGLHDTHYTSPSGVVDRGNYSSAYDLAALARYAMAIPRFRAFTRTHIAHVKWAKPTYAKTYVNKNLLIGTYRGADGVKTGWTTIAGHCLVASARRGGTRLIAVVLHSPDPYGDARRMLNFGFANP